MTTNVHSELETALMQAMSEIESIDCHEHLGPEANRTSAEVDVFTLFSHYTYGDLSCAGMSHLQYGTLFDRKIPLEVRWRIFKPYWERIRWTSFSRAARLAAEKFYGIKEIDESTIQPLSDAMRQANTPGIYERVLGDACRIRVALTVQEATESMDLGTPRLRAVASISQFHPVSPESLANPPFAPGSRVRTLDDYLDAMQVYLHRVKSEGAVGIKMWARPYGPPDAAAARAAFTNLQAGRCLPPGSPMPLSDYLLDRTMTYVTELDLAVSVHTGYWGDFRQLNPLHMIPVLQRHPRARFDIFHLGYPWVRETLMLGKGFPNVWINLCWTHVISQRCAAGAIDEAIDLLPSNKLLAFGGDYGLPVEKVYGHMIMAREDIARVLAARIARGYFTEKQALDLARRWFWSNAIELYRLDI